MSPRRGGSLAAQLQFRIVVTVAVMALLMCLGTVLSARVILFDQLDRDVLTVKDRQIGGMRPDDPLAGLHSSSGIPDGTVILAPTERGAVPFILAPEGTKPPSADDLRRVPADGKLHTVNLQVGGKYRALAYDTPFGEVTVGVPVGRVETTLLRLTTFSIGLSLIALAATAIATRTVLTRATRNLVTLTNTADEVSQLELVRGAVEVPRVETAEAHENNEVTRLSSAFNRMLGNVESAFTAREASEKKMRRFVADASHELRNPLAAIRGYAELAQRAPDATDSQFAMGRIESESTRMAKLVNDLLLLARLDADARVEPRPVDAVEVVLNAVSDAQAASSDHRWLLDVPTSEITVLADPDQLHQVMVNLLANARTHTPPGTTVHTSVRIVDGRAVIQVADDGPGIPEDTLPRVFERFTKADEARAHTAAQSTGLGLAIVKAMVEGWGGLVDVASRPGLTTFSVGLTLADAENVPAVQTTD